MSKSKWHFTRLSRDQISQLCTLATAAHKAAVRRGHPDAELKPEEWRKRGQDEATGTKGFSLRTATQSDYLPLRGYWWVIIGNVEQAFYDFLNSGDQNERCRQLKWRLAGECSRLADGIKYDKLHLPVPVNIADDQAAKEAWSYMRALSRDKFEGRSPESLPPDELFQLCNTVFNRASAKLKVGSRENRNKKQRNQPAKRKASPAQDGEAEARRTTRAPMWPDQFPAACAESPRDQAAGTNQQTA